MLRNEVEIENNFRESRVNVKIPISSSITNHEALEVIGGLGAVGPACLEVVLMELPRKVGHIDAGVALT